MTTHSQRALILHRRRRFINHLLTYLLTYLNGIGNLAVAYASERYDV